MAACSASTTTTRAPAAAKDTAATPLPLGSVVARVPLARPGVDPDADAAAQLARALDQARAANAALRIVGPAGETGAGLGQARTVAQDLIRLGARPDQLTVAVAGSGDEVLVYLAQPPAS